MAGNLIEQLKSWRCARRYRRLILQSLDNDLGAASQLAPDSYKEAHLKNCASCRALIERQKLASELLSQYRLPDAPPAGKPQWSLANAERKPATAAGQRASLSPVFKLSLAFGVVVFIVLVVGSAWRYFYSPQAAWEVIRLAGTPKVGQRLITYSGSFTSGEALETDSDSRAMIQVGVLGQVEVDPNSRLRLLSTAPTDHRLALERGKLYATILAPPRYFSVETPSAVAIDMGCAYSLEVDDTGEGRLRVTSGWVALNLQGREALVPAGAVCITRPGVGPGTPVFEDASDKFKKAIHWFDLHDSSAPKFDVIVEAILSEARPKDALTLWHLLPRVHASNRIAVFERLVLFAPLPDGVTREGLLRLDRQMLDAWREKVEYVSIGVDPEKAPVAGGSLNPAGAMIDARFNHSATLLEDGRVLLAGGREKQGQVLAGAELYDPATGQFTTTEQMKTRRVGHTATLLPNGKVLIAGGSDSEFFFGALSSAELFDPATGAFTPTGNMKVPRLAHQATLLQNGEVLITGGQGEEWANRDSAELYNPDTGTFRNAGTMIEKRADHTATRLADGRVLLTGGAAGRFPPVIVSSGAELYDPATDKFTRAGPMNLMRFKHSAALLPDGRVIVIGGSNAQMFEGRYVSAELFDPATGQFAATGQMNTARYKIRDAVVLLNTGKILVAGGGGRAELYDPATGLFAAVKGGLGTARFYASATLLKNGEVLIAGGYNSDWTGHLPANASAWIYKPEQ